MVVLMLLAKWAGKAAGLVGKILRAVPPVVWIIAAALLAAYLYGEGRHDAGYTQAKAEYEAQALVDSEQAARFLAEETERNRIAEQELGAQLHQAAIDHAQALKDLEARTGRTVADLRTGNLKLRQHWQACLSRPDPSAPIGPADVAGADLRAADIGRVQGIAGACDAAVKRWQTVWEQVRTSVNAQGNDHAAATR